MDAQQVAEVVSRPYAQQLLGSSVPARFAYTALDGTPRVVPVAFWWDDGALVVSTVVGSAKVAAVRANPRVAVTIDTEAFPPKALMLRGPVDVRVVDGVPDVYVAASRKQVPPEAFAGWEAGVRALYEQMAVLTLVPDWATLLDFETTIPRAVQALVDRAQAARDRPG